MLISSLLHLPGWVPVKFILFTAASAKYCAAFFLRFYLLTYLFMFRERERDREVEGEKYRLVASHMPTIRDLACNPGLCPDQESNRLPFDVGTKPNPLSHTSQGYCATF